MSESNNCTRRAPLDARWMYRQVYDLSKGNTCIAMLNDLSRKVQIT
jgi:hypothetical protein